MSTPDPDDPAEGRRSGDKRGDRRADLPSDVDAAFAAIVAEWAAADAPRWPGAEHDRDRAADDGPSSGIGTATPPGGWRPGPGPGPGPGATIEPSTPPPAPRDPDLPAAAHRPYPAEPPAEEFVAPEPPPLPRLGLSAIAGLLLLIIGVVLLAIPGVLGAPVGLGIVPGLLAMTAGLGWLVFGLRRSNEDDDEDPEDGAVL